MRADRGRGRQSNLPSKLPVTEMSALGQKLTSRRPIECRQWERFKHGCSGCKGFQTYPMSSRGHEWVAKNPTRADRHAGSFSVNLRSGKWADFATGDKGGDVVALAASAIVSRSSIISRFPISSMRLAPQAASR